MEASSRLLALRKKHGLTQKQLAAIIGCAYTTIHRIEKQKSYPSLITIKKIFDLWGEDIGKAPKHDESTLPVGIR